MSLVLFFDDLDLVGVLATSVTRVLSCRWYCSPTGGVPVRVEEGRAGASKCHWLHTSLAKEAQDERYSLTRTLDVRFEAGQTVVFDLFRQAPTKVGDESGLGLLNGFVVLRTLELDVLLYAHDLDMVEVLGCAAHDSVHRVHLALLNDPALCL